MKTIIFFFFLFPISLLACEEQLVSLSELKTPAKLFIQQFMQNSQDIKRSKAMSCPKLDQIKDKDQLIISFEGAGGYAPKMFYLKQFLKQSNIKTKDEFYTICEMMEIKNECVELYSEAYKEFGVALPLVRDLVLDYLNQKDSAFFYYGQKHSQQAYRCIKELQQKAQENNIVFPKLKVIGYSWGSNAGIKFLKKLDRNKIEFKVTKLLTIDPVRKGPGVVKNLFTDKDNKFFEKADGLVDEHTNIYQKSDKKSLFVGIKGNSIKTSDYNIEYVPEYDWYAHVYIVEDQITRKELEKFLKD